MVTIISIIIVVALYMMLGIAVVAVAFMLSLFPVSYTHLTLPTKA